MTNSATFEDAIAAVRNLVGKRVIVTITCPDGLYYVGDIAGTLDQERPYDPDDDVAAVFFMREEPRSIVNLDSDMFLRAYLEDPDRLDLALGDIDITIATAPT